MKEVETNEKGAKRALLFIICFIITIAGVTYSNHQRDIVYNYRVQINNSVKWTSGVIIDKLERDRVDVSNLGKLDKPELDVLISDIKEIKTLARGLIPDALGKNAKSPIQDAEAALENYRDKSFEVKR